MNAQMVTKTLEGALTASMDVFSQNVARKREVIEALDEFFYHAMEVRIGRVLNPTWSDQHTTMVQQCSRLVFSLYVRGFAYLKQTRGPKNSESVDDMFHLTRVVPFVQVFAMTQQGFVRDLLEELGSKRADFRQQVTTLAPLFLKSFSDVHRQLHKPDILPDQERESVLRHLYELSVYLSAIVSVFDPFVVLSLQNGAPSENLESQTLLHQLVVCYESDLPLLQNHSTSTTSVSLQTLGRLRQNLLQVLEIALDALVTARNEGGEETLLALLHLLAHCNSEEDVEQGSLLSDLWGLWRYKDKCAAFLASLGVDTEHLSYIQMIVDGLPQRRATVVKAQAKEANAAPVSIVSVSQHATQSETQMVLDSMVQQVKELFPDLGDGYVELCLVASENQLESVINALLEGSPPTAVAQLPTSLSRKSVEFNAALSKIQRKSDKPTAEKSERVDPSRVWVGKKKSETTYDPQSLKKDAELTNKMKTLLQSYDMVSFEDVDVENVGRLEQTAVDEYDDDYNDEFDDYEPFGVNDDRSGDLDEIREQNRLIRAKEEEEAFWESMRNPNHRLREEEEEAEELEEKEGGEATATTTTTPPRQQRSSPSKNSQQKKKTTTQKGRGSNTRDSAGASSSTSTSETQAQPGAQRERNWKDKNKSKVGNHHRKDRALKKQAKGM